MVFVFSITKMVIYFMDKLKIIKNKEMLLIIVAKNSNGFGLFIKMIFKLNKNFMGIILFQEN